jgi:hypothetical protein
MATQTHPKFVRWALLIGIVIALNLFFVAVQSMIVAEPKYEDYCPATQQDVLTEESCVAQDGIWVGTQSDSRTPGVTKPNQEGYCDFYQKCQPIYDAAREEHDMFAFALMVGFGVLALIVGVIPMGSSIVSSGLSYGGVLALIIAAGGYWNEAGQLLRLAISLVALGALLYLGIKRFKD